MAVPRAPILLAAAAAPTFSQQLKSAVQTAPGKAAQRSPTQPAWEQLQARADTFPACRTFARRASLASSRACSARSSASCLPSSPTSWSRS